MMPLDDCHDGQQIYRYNEVEETARLRLSAREIEDQSLNTTTQIRQNYLRVARYTKIYEIDEKIGKESDFATPDTLLEMLRSKHSKELAALLTKHEAEISEAAQIPTQSLNSTSEEVRQAKLDLDHWHSENQLLIEKYAEERREEMRQRRKLEDEKLGEQLLRAFKGRMSQALSCNTLSTPAPSPKGSSQTTTPTKVEKRKYIKFDVDGYDSDTPLIELSSQPSTKSMPASAKRQKVDNFPHSGGVPVGGGSDKSTVSCTNSGFTSPHVQQKSAKMQLDNGLVMVPPATNNMSKIAPLVTTPSRKPGSTSSSRSHASPTSKHAALNILSTRSTISTFAVRDIRFINLNNDPCIWNRSDKQKLDLHLQGSQFIPLTSGHQRQWHLREWTISPSRVWNIKTNARRSLVQINRKKEGTAKADLWVRFRDESVFSAFMEAYRVKWPGTLIEERPDLECPKMFVRSQEGEWW